MLYRAIAVSLPNSTLQDLWITDIENTTCIFSNMIASLQGLWEFGGKKVDWVAQIGSISNTLSISTTTLGRKIKINLLADEGLFPHLNQLGDAIVKELTTTEKI